MRPSSPSRLPVSAMTRAELLAELTLAVPHASFQPAAPRNPDSQHSELGVQNRDDVEKARSQHDLGVILEAERDKKDACARVASQSAQGGRAAPVAGAPPSAKKKVHVESPSVSPPRTDPFSPHVAHELLNHISSAFPQHQSVMQNLATAEQCHEHIVLLLSQAKQCDNPPQSQFVQYLAESTVQLMLKMDSLQGYAAPSHFFLRSANNLLPQCKTSVSGHFASVCCCHVRKLPRIAGCFKSTLSKLICSGSKRNKCGSTASNGRSRLFKASACTSRSYSRITRTWKAAMASMTIMCSRLQ